jgi:hypothetical protein
MPFSSMASVAASEGRGRLEALVTAARRRLPVLQSDAPDVPDVADAADVPPRPGTE